MSMDGGDGLQMWILNTHTIGVVVLILTCQLLNWFWSRCHFRFRSKPNTHGSQAIASSSPISESGISNLISDFDMKLLLDDLEEKSNVNEKWEHVIDRKSNLISYTAKCFKPKGEPLRYSSVTVFESCSIELLRDFYMDNDYRASWDNTVLEHEQLQVDASCGVEIGRMVKKFGFLSPREYVMAWRLWEDEQGDFYCLSKGCEHPFAPRQKKYVRATFYRSGWRIRKVTGRNACEIEMVHQEDVGLNEGLAKLAFAKGIWSYISKMDDALRRYSSEPRLPSIPGTQKVDNPESSAIKHQAARDSSRSFRRPSKTVIKKGLIILGGAVCLSRGRSSLAAKVAMAYILTKLSQRGSSSRPSRKA